VTGASARRRTHPAVLTLAILLVVAAVLFILGVVPGTMRSMEAARAARAVGAIRRINTAAADYRRQHGADGFPAELAALRSSLAASYQGVASGVWNGYRFDYRATRDASGAISHYTIQARPNKYTGDLCRSFYSDDSGVIRATTENRAATLADAALPPPE
jgi:type II secretory pathway pseudopilin PulG